MRRTKQEGLLREQEDAELEEQVQVQAEAVLADPYNPYGGEGDPWDAATKWVRRQLQEKLDKVRAERAAAQPPLPEYAPPEQTQAVGAAVERYRLATRQDVFDAFMKRYPGNRSRADWAAGKVETANRPVSFGQLQAFVRRHKSPQDAKEHLKSLTVVQKAIAEAEEQWDEQRVRLALRTLLAVAEQVGNVMGHGFEPKLSAPPERDPSDTRGKHRRQAQWEFELPQVVVGRAVARIMRMVEDKRRERWRKRVRARRKRAAKRAAELKRKEELYKRAAMERRAAAERVERERERVAREEKRKARQFGNAEDDEGDDEAPSDVPPPPSGTTPQADTRAPGPTQPASRGSSVGRGRGRGRAAGRGQEQGRGRGRGRGSAPSSRRRLAAAGNQPPPPGGRGRGRGRGGPGPGPGKPPPPPRAGSKPPPPPQASNAAATPGDGETEMFGNVAAAADIELGEVDALAADLAPKPSW